MVRVGRAEARLNHGLATRLKHGVGTFDATRLRKPIMSQPMPRPEDRCRDHSELPQPPAYRSEGFYEDLGDAEPAKALRRQPSWRPSRWAWSWAATARPLRTAG